MSSVILFQRVLGSGAGQSTLTIRAEAEEKAVDGELKQLADKLGKVNAGPSLREWLFKVERIELSVTGAVTVSQDYPAGFDLPGVLLVEKNGIVRLRSMKEVENDAAALRVLLGGGPAEEGLAKVYATLEALRLDFGRDLGIFGFQVSEQATFLAVKGVVGAATARAELRLDAGALIAAREGPTGREVLRAEMNAEVSFGTRQGRVRIAVAVTDREAAEGLEEVVDLIAGLDLPPIPGLPRLGLDFPRLPFPGFRLDGLEIGNPFRLFDLPLPSVSLPGLPELPGLPLGIEWAQQPKFRLSLVDGRLGVESTQVGQGMIVWRDGNVPLAEVQGLDLKFVGNAFAATGTVKAREAATLSPISARTEIGAQGSLPVTLDLAEAAVRVAVAGAFDLGSGMADAGTAITGSIDWPRIVIRAKEDPSLVLGLRATYEVTAPAGGSLSGRLTRLEVVEPYPVELIALAAKEAIAGLVRLVGLIELPGAPEVGELGKLPKLPDLTRVIERIGDLLAACLRWMARGAGAAVGVAAQLLTGLAEAALELMGRVLRLLAAGAQEVLSHVAVEVRLDAGTYALRQVLITPLRQRGTPTGANAKPIELAGLSLTLPAAWDATLLMDFSGAFWAGLLVAPPMGNTVDRLVLGTDLWLKRDGAPAEAVRDTRKDGKPPSSHLIEMRAWLASAGTGLAVAAVDGGKVSFLKAVDGVGADPDELTFEAGQVDVSIGRYRSRPELRDVSEADIGVEFGTDWETPRLLPFFDTPKADQANAGTSLIDKLGQYVEVTGAKGAALKGSVLTVPLVAAVHLDAMTTSVDLVVRLDLGTLMARLDVDGPIKIRGKRKQGDIFGLTYVIRPNSEAFKNGPPENKDGLLTGKDGLPIEFTQFELDFSTGSPRMALSREAAVDLFYTRLGGGRGLVFKVTDFAVAQGAFDVTAEVDPEEPVTLPGVDMPFRFESGQLVVKRGEIQTFAIEGAGQLPPELVGEANCRVRLSLGREPGTDRLAVLSCDAMLDKGESPIVCHSTRFTLTLSHLGFALEDLRGEGGYQFYFLLTGTLEFTPQGSEFSDTFLKHLRRVKITLDKAPLARDLSRLSRAIDIHIPIEPKVTFDLFEVFEFELRGIGYLGSCDAFGGDPALVLSGQAKLTPSMDAVSAKFDFHKMYFARPLPGQNLPRVRFDGLGVSLSLGAGTVEATAIAVDGNLPTLYRPDTLPAGIKARGFLASGRIDLKSWAPMSAAMGFLEIEKPNGDRRHSFFLYGQAEKLVTPIPTPIKPIYLRQVGFGFGFRYTLAGLRRADAATTPTALIEVLDDVSRYQNDLAQFEAWEPETEGDRLTLALAGMVSIDHASSEGKLSKAEAELPNALLMDVSAALRSDLTFLMTVRAWLSTNYADWVNADDRQAIATRPTLRGYLYISAPRQELLARLLSDPKGHIGSHPKLPDPLVKAFRNTTWSSTLYIRPGLFHFEMGWPYELEFKLEERNFGLTCQGGMVMRVEDGSVLYGVAFRATGWAELGGQVGGRSLGASAQARAEFSLDAKFIAYVSLARGKDTLFYGSVAFTCTVKVEVRIWLEIDLGFDEIRLEMGLSLSFTLSLALEVAVGPSVLAARGAASLGVSAFGRTLFIGIGFAIGGNQLDEARQRVARFLALGLTTAVPDPAQGLATPAPAAAPSRAGDEAAKHAAVKSGVLGETEEGLAPGEVIEMGGVPVGQPRFWALLFEVEAAPGAYVMQLIPRDHTTVDIAEFQLDSAASTFFAFPDGNEETDKGEASTLAYQLATPDGTPVELIQLLADGTVVLASNTTARYGVDVAASGDKKLALRKLLEQSFLPKTATFDPETGQVRKRMLNREKPLQPPFEAIEARDTRPASPGGEAEMRGASADMAGLSLRRAEWRATEERRSALITAVAASAEVIARDAWLEGDEIRWPAASGRAEVDARDLGLTFMIRKADLPPLQEGPPELGFTVLALGGANQQAEQASQRVHLFNPPERFFDVAQPRLKDPRAWITADGVALDWDLEPGWSESAGVWEDPEFHLRHYRIERLVQVGGRVVEGLPPSYYEAKAAAPLTAVVEGETGTVSWERIRPPAQFADDFADVPRRFRPALRQRNPHMGEGFADIRQALGELGVQDGEEVRLVYTVIPVDIAGHEGVPTPIELVLPRPEVPVSALGGAEMEVEFGAFPGLAGSEATLTLRIDDLLDHVPEDPEQVRRLPPEGTRFEIRLRRERAVLLGEFGAEALGQALQRPGPADFAREEKDDRTLEVELAWPKGTWTAASRKKYAAEHALDFVPFDGAADGLRFLFSTGDGLDELHKALGVDTESPASPRPVRVAVRRVLRRPQPGAEVEDRPSPWLPVDLTLRVIDATKQVRPPIETMVEAFEMPVVAGYAPLGFDDLGGDSGRLLVDYPEAGATLDQLIGTARGLDGALPLQRLRDGERRVATRLSWAMWPTAEVPTLGGVPTAYTSREHIAGYDLFEIDLTGLNREEDQVTAARHVGRARLLDPRVGKAEPAGIEDFGKVEAFYPSEGLRLAERVGSARRRAWFSPAESLLAWPKPTLRRSIGLAVEELDLAPLFEKGQPRTIRVEWTAEAEKRIAALKRSTDAPGPTPPRFAWTQPEGEWNAAGHGVTVDDFAPGLVEPGATTWSPASARALVFGLVLGLTAEAASWGGEDWVKIYLKAADPSPFKALPFKLRGLWEGPWTKPETPPENPRETGSVTLTAELHSPLHPVLADVLDALRWDRDDAAAPIRRYLPVLEAPPTTKAATVTELIDERPAERDPAGWAMLRTLGLAQGFRLFDTVRAAYVDPHGSRLKTPGALELIEAAMSEMHRRYRGLPIGAPFVEVMVRPNGLLTTASFDGGTPPLVPQRVKDVLANETVCLAQISLRPVAEAFLDGKEDRRKLAARYFIVKGWTAKPIGIGGEAHWEVAFDGSGLDEDVLIDVIDLLGGANSGRPIPLAKGDTSLAATAFAGGRTTFAAVALRVPDWLVGDDGKPKPDEKDPKEGVPLALLRVLSRSADGRAQAERALGMDEAAADNGLQEMTLPTVLQEGRGQVRDARGDAIDPFERFPALDGAAIAALAVAGSDGKVNERLRDAFLDFGRHAWRRFGQNPLRDPDPQAFRALADRWPGFCRRFLAQGPGALSQVPKSDATVQDRPRTAFAMATLPQTEPLRLVPDSQGRMTVMLLHKDRFARRRRYVVRPVGRYEALVAAWDRAYADVPGAEGRRIPWATRRTLRDSFADSPEVVALALPKLRFVEDRDDRLAACSIDLGAPRTEPLASPVILSAARLDVGEGAGRRPGRLIEFVVSRHAEEIASEANIHVADGLQFEHQAFGFWREFAQPRWAEAFPGDVIDLLPEIGFSKPVEPGERSLTGTGLIEAMETVDLRAERQRAGLPARIADGWRGITALRTDAVPHFYRTHMVAFAAAGVVVSRAVAAMVPEGHFELHWPWDGEADRIGRISDPPTWEVERDDEDGTAAVVLDLPLLRNLDGMPPEERASWIADPRDVPSIFHLPDPQVAYELSARAVAEAAPTDAALAGDVQAVAEYLALPGANEGQALRRPTYVAKGAAPFLKPKDIAEEVARDGGGTPWRLRPRLLGRAAVDKERTDTEREVLETQVTRALQDLGRVEATHEAWRVPSAPWPTTELQVSIRAPSQVGTEDLDWAAWRERLQPARDALERYAPDGGTGPAIEALFAVLARLRAFLDIAHLGSEPERVERWRQLTGAAPIAEQPATMTMTWPAGVPLWPSKVEGGGDRMNPILECSEPGTWTAGGIGERVTGLNARVTAMAALEGARPRVHGTPADPPYGTSAREIARTFHIAAWAWDMADLTAADVAPFGGFASLARAVPKGLRALARVLALALPDRPDGGQLSPSAVWEFVAPIAMSFAGNAAAPGYNDAFRALVEALRTSTAVMPEGATQGPAGLGFYPALAALAAVEQAEGPVTVNLRLPLSALGNKHPVRIALDNLVAARQAHVVSGDLNMVVPDLLVLRRPPSQADIAAVSEADADLLPLLHAAAADQIFGRGRRPFLKASKGFAPPIVAAVERVT